MRIAQGCIGILLWMILHTYQGNQSIDGSAQCFLYNYDTHKPLLFTEGSCGTKIGNTGVYYIPVRYIKAYYANK